MEHISSLDGTRIAYHRGGTGTPLILVHGSGAANPIAWTEVIPTLEAHYTVYAPDRRGRGASGDGPVYTFKREVEDISALIEAIGVPLFLMGHSFGALCALEAALCTPHILKLILYEPGITFPDLPLYPEGVIARLQTLLDSGDPEGALTTLYREVVMMASDEIEQLRTSPAWTARVASAHPLVREAQAETQYTFDAQRFKHLSTPTLFLMGGDSPAFLKRATEMVAAALPNNRISILPGQQHTAMYTAPHLFLQEIMKFLAQETDT